MKRVFVSLDQLRRRVGLDQAVDRVEIAGLEFLLLAFQSFLLVTQVTDPLRLLLALLFHGG